MRWGLVGIPIALGVVPLACGRDWEYSYVPSTQPVADAQTDGKPADSSFDAGDSNKDVVFEAFPSDGSCGGGTKSCGGLCVAVEDPQFGCTATGCSPCAIPQAKSKCLSGVCAVSVCAPGWKDCDGDLANGCEASLWMDPLNCGDCSFKCATQPQLEACHYGKCDSTCKGIGTDCSSGPYGCCDGDCVANKCCTKFGKQCSADDQCCVGRCTDTLCCLPVGATCELQFTQHKCCEHLNCEKDKCCRQDEQPCGGSAECCSGACGNGVCCRNLGVACTAGSQCCSGECSTTCCKSAGTSCQADAECCNRCNLTLSRCCSDWGGGCKQVEDCCQGGPCTRGSCCVAPGEACPTDSKQCCGGGCVAGKCCIANGASFACQSSAECCSNNCNAGRCCLPSGTKGCFLPNECCSGSCLGSIEATVCQ